jgi:hypothetical protein
MIEQKLYIKELIGKTKPRSVSRFLDIFFIAAPELRSTYRLRTSATYSDSKCTLLHCTEGRMRSYDDLYLLVKTYYPKIAHKRLIRILLTKIYSYEILVDVSKGIKVPYYTPASLYNCSTMRRIRLTYSGARNTAEGTIPIWGGPMDKYDSKYSWEDLFKLANIPCSNTTEYTDYIKKYMNKHKVIVEIK